MTQNRKYFCCVGDSHVNIQPNTMMSFMCENAIQALDLYLKTVHSRACDVIIYSLDMPNFYYHFQLINTNRSFSITSVRIGLTYDHGDQTRLDKEQLFVELNNNPQSIYRIKRVVTKQTHVAYAIDTYSRMKLVHNGRSLVFPDAMQVLPMIEVSFIQDSGTMTDVMSSATFTIYKYNYALHT